MDRWVAHAANAENRTIPIIPGRNVSSFFTAVVKLVLCAPAGRKACS